MSKLSVMKSVVIGGAVAAAMAVMPIAAAEASVGSNSAAPTHVIFHQDPGGSGCAPNGGPCGSGGQDSGPGGGPGGQGCVAGVGCGFGGQNAGPGGVPGGCLYGVGCGHA
jgi:hypothetical protein